MTTAAAEPSAGRGPLAGGPPVPPQTILSFDVEEHDLIEAAVGLDVDDEWKVHYRGRLEPTTDWLLEELERGQIRATFFIVGQIAQHSPKLVQKIHAAGHEVASHSWKHARVSKLTPETFRDDLRTSRDALEQVTGERVVGYRAPTFSIGRQSAWALDVLAEEGFLYDSSIYPVRHDRYGEPFAPRTPFVAWGEHAGILELPPATLRVFGGNLPVGGGGYFRLLPSAFLEWGIRQAARALTPPVATIYFHPWEFDPEQRRLPLAPVSRFRTYVGIGRSKDRLVRLLSRHRFVRAVDVARQLSPHVQSLARYSLVDPAAPQPARANAPRP